MFIYLFDCETAAFETAWGRVIGSVNHVTLDLRWHSEQGSAVDTLHIVTDLALALPYYLLFKRNLAIPRGLYLKKNVAL